jgi:DNA polymerase-3 subunit delta
VRLTAEQFLERPPKTLPPLVVIHGAEPLAALEAADALRAIARDSGYSEREVFTAESGFDWGRLLGAANALSLFATLRMIEVRIPTGKPGKEGGAAIERYCQRLPADTLTLVLLPEMDWQMKQAKWFGTLESVATMIEAMPVERPHLPRWLAGRLARQQQSATAEALDCLADRVEGNLLAAQQEIRKLALLCPPGEISLALLEDSVANVSRFNPAQLVAAMYEGADRNKVARIYRMLDGMKAEGEAPPLILWILSNELRMLMRLRGFTRGGRAPHPSKTRELERVSRHHSRSSLTALNLQAARIDRMIKGLDGSDPWSALAQLACGIGGVRSPMSRRAA